MWLPKEGAFAASFTCCDCCPRLQSFVSFTSSLARPHSLSRATSSIIAALPRNAILARCPTPLKTLIQSHIRYSVAHRRPKHCLTKQCAPKQPRKIPDTTTRHLITVHGSCHDKSSLPIAALGNIAGPFSRLHSVSAPLVNRTTPRIYAERRVPLA